MDEDVQYPTRVGYRMYDGGLYDIGLLYLFSHTEEEDSRKPFGLTFSSGARIENGEAACVGNNGKTAAKDTLATLLLQIDVADKYVDMAMKETTATVPKQHRRKAPKDHRGCVALWNTAADNTVRGVIKNEDVVYIGDFQVSGEGNEASSDSAPVDVWPSTVVRFSEGGSELHYLRGSRGDEKLMQVPSIVDRKEAATHAHWAAKVVSEAAASIVRALGDAGGAATTAAAAAAAPGDGKTSAGSSPKKQPSKKAVPEGPAGGGGGGGGSAAPAAAAAAGAVAKKRTRAAAAKSSVAAAAAASEFFGTDLKLEEAIFGISSSIMNRRLSEPTSKVPSAGSSRGGGSRGGGRRGRGGRVGRGGRGGRAAAAAASASARFAPKEDEETEEEKEDSMDVDGSDDESDEEEEAAATPKRAMQPRKAATTGPKKAKEAAAAAPAPTAGKRTRGGGNPVLRENALKKAAKSEAAALKKRASAAAGTTAAVSATATNGTDSNKNKPPPKKAGKTPIKKRLSGDLKAAAAASQEENEDDDDGDYSDAATKRVAKRRRGVAGKKIAASAAAAVVVVAKKVVHVEPEALLTAQGTEGVRELIVSNLFVAPHGELWFSTLPTDDWSKALSAAALQVGRLTSGDKGKARAAASAAAAAFAKNAAEALKSALEVCISATNAINAVPEAPQVEALALESASTFSDAHNAVKDLLAKCAGAHLKHDATLKALEWLKEARGLLPDVPSVEDHTAVACAVLDEQINRVGSYCALWENVGTKSFADAEKEATRMRAAQKALGSAELFDEAEGKASAMLALYGPLVPGLSHSKAFAAPRGGWSSSCHVM